MKGKAYRRAQERKIKKKYGKILKSMFGDTVEEPSEKDVGRFASVHGAGCSCAMCGNTRRSVLSKGGDKTTIQEHKSDMDFEEEKNDI